MKRSTGMTLAPFLAVVILSHGTFSTVEAVPLAAFQSGRLKVKPVKLPLQSASEYAADYVKDENSDNGEWQAQVAYDQLRVKVRSDKKEVEKAKADMPGTAQKYKDEKAREQAVADKAKSASEDAVKAKEKADKIKKEGEEAEAKVEDARKDADATERELQDEAKRSAASEADVKQKKAKEESVRKEEEEAEQEEKTVEQEEKAADQEEKKAEQEEAGSRMAIRNATEDGKLSRFGKKSNATTDSTKVNKTQEREREAKEQREREAKEDKEREAKEEKERDAKAAAAQDAAAASAAAEEKVKNATTALKDQEAKFVLCQKQLQEAKAKLADATAAEAAKIAMGDAKAIDRKQKLLNEAATETKKANDLQQAEEEVQAQHDASTKAAADYSSAHAEIASDVKKATERKDVAAKAHQDKVAKLADAKAALARSGMKLKGFRGGSLPADGDAAPSAGTRTQISLVVTVATSLAALLALARNPL